MSSERQIAIIGASGGIGSAFVEAFTAQAGTSVYAFSRRELARAALNLHWHAIELEAEDSIAKAAASLNEDIALDAVIVASGFLHDDTTMPEKSLRELSAAAFEQNFRINCIAPALIAKHFLPKLKRDQRSVFAALSARVGSISDNRMGGWYAYRASKAALNMVIKNLAIEHGRRRPEAIIVGLHPGTVDTALSKPFQGNVPEGKLFTPEQSAQYLLQVIDGLTPDDSGKCFAWDAKLIDP